MRRVSWWWCLGVTTRPRAIFWPGVKEPTLRVVEVPYLPKPPLGALRNLAVQAAQGTYIAQWDDDDWHGPTRLAEQLRALADQRYSACALMRWVLYDELTRQAYVSGPRAWEASLVARREALPPYPELARGEDTPVVEQLMAQDQLIGLTARTCTSTPTTAPIPGAAPTGAATSFRMPSDSGRKARSASRPCCAGTTRRWTPPACSGCGAEAAGPARSSN